MSTQHLRPKSTEKPALSTPRRDLGNKELMRAHQRPYWTSVLSETNYPAETLKQYGIGRSAIPFSEDHRRRRWL